MVIAGKVFKLIAPQSLEEFAPKLENYRLQQDYEEGDYRFALITEVASLSSTGNAVSGIYSQDHIIHVFHRGKTIPVPRTVEAVFSFRVFNGKTLLTVVEKKRIANFIANKISAALFEKVGNIVEAQIPPETLQSFHLRNPEDTKITFFDNIDIPNVDKLSLYGPDLVGTTLFEEYSQHGDVWYIVARAREYGYVVGITRDASVTIFNLADKEKYLEYVAKEIYPLV
ncbi:MAG TPA: hypothetical protein VMW14_01140 [Candidatus Paceibacterota bacterium]|nr:hypothetical protein [Candidatus Paceibacterota bacterium]